MGPRYVAELAEGSRVDAAFALRGKELRAARNGDAYLTLRFGDRTGEIPGVYFRPAAESTSVPVGTIVRVAGTVTTFKGLRRVSVESFRPAEQWDPADFVPTGTRPIDELMAEFKQLCGSVSDAPLKRLLRGVFGDASFMDRFKRCPGSQSYHHAYLGGLLEHTTAVAAICAAGAARYDGVDRDLIVTAALLHDIGKVDELVFDSTIDYSDTGRLLGHVVLGVQRLQDRARHARIDPQRLVRLEHAVLSHHGELEWGAPKRPSTLEALLLHHADNLDAKAQGFAAVLAGACRADERWTDASNLFRRPLYAPRAIEDDREYPASEASEQYARTA